MSGHDGRPSIAILGGGTAGWITANTLAHAWGERVAICLIESPDIGTVGVGEGSTPRLKHFMDTLGIDEADWMPRCNATYKNGISFVNWSTRKGFERYFHPFASELDRHTATAFYYNTYARRQGADVCVHPDRFFLAARLSSNRQGPLANENFPFEVEYGYHFDAGLLGNFLRDHATGRGVRHLPAKVTDVNLTQDGNIESLVTDTVGTVNADFFVDCSGFRSTLLQQTLGVNFESYAVNLFNDAAVVLPSEQTDDIDVQTVSTALQHGWAWRIPLTHRIGNGYVYSSSHCSFDEAELELRRHLGLIDAPVEARHLQMRVGRVKEHWHKNCLAVGLSQGFIEPLEATALNLVCNAVTDFVECADPQDFAAADRAAYNQRTHLRFESIRDYIVAHYILNTREDSDYWRQNAANLKISDTLKQILQIWKSGQSLSQEMQRQQIESSYTALSWYCLLSGYGFYPELREGFSDDKTDMGRIDDFIARCALNFPAHRQQLAG